MRNDEQCHELPKKIAKNLKNVFLSPKKIRNSHEKFPGYRLIIDYQKNSIDYCWDDLCIRTSSF